MVSREGRRTRREQQRSERIRAAADATADLVGNSVQPNEYQGVLPREVRGYTLQEDLKRSRSQEFVHRLGEKGFAAVVYDGYTYRGDSASEVDPFQLYVVKSEIFKQSSEVTLQAPVDPSHVLKVWAQSENSKINGGGEDE